MSGDAAKAQTRQLFDRLATDYDSGGPGCFAHYGERLVRMAGLEPGQRILDVATGRGAVLCPAAARVGPQGEVIGIDLAEAMVLLASEAAAERGLVVRVRTMDAERLTFADHSFDRVLCGFGVMFFPDLARALTEFRRVLKPGGRIGLSSWRDSQSAAIEVVLRELGIADLRNSPALRFNTAATLVAPLTAAGFDDIAVMADETTFLYADAEQYWQNARGTGLRQILDAFDAEQARRVKAALADHLQQYRRDDGYHVPAAALIATARR